MHQVGAGRRPPPRPRAEEKQRGLGAKETKEQGLGGLRAPSRRRPQRKNGPGLGAKETKEQGLGGLRAPSRRRPRRKNGPGLGAKETKEQGIGGLRAPSRPRPAARHFAEGSTSPGPTPPAPEEKWPGTWCKGNEGTRVRGLSCTKSAPASGPIAPGRRPVTPFGGPPSAGGLTPRPRPPTPAASHFGRQPYRPPAVSPLNR